MRTSNNEETKTSALPSERVRALADIVRRAWEPFTDEERIELLAIVNADRAPLDADAIDKMLAATGGNIGLAATNLGVCRRTLQSKMRRLGMPPSKAGPKYK